MLEISIILDVTGDFLLKLSNTLGIMEELTLKKPILMKELMEVANMTKAKYNTADFLLWIL